jgi:hypothetical protein
MVARTYSEVGSTLSQALSAQPNATPELQRAVQMADAALQQHGGETIQDLDGDAGSDDGSGSAAGQDDAGAGADHFETDSTR